MKNVFTKIWNVIKFITNWIAASRFSYIETLGISTSLYAMVKYNSFMQLFYGLMITVVLSSILRAITKNPMV